MAVPVAEPTYLNVNCGNAAWNCGWIRLGIRPESLTSLVPTIESVDALSALASAGDSIRTSGGQEAEDGEGQQPAQAGAGRKAGGKRAPTWVNGLGHRASI